MLKSVKDWIEGWRRRYFRNANGSSNGMHVPTKSDPSTDKKNNSLAKCSVHKEGATDSEQGTTLNPTTDTVGEDQASVCETGHDEHWHVQGRVEASTINAAAAGAAKVCEDEPVVFTGSVLYCNNSGADGRGRAINPRRFLVLKGSKGRKQPVVSCPEHILRKRNELISLGVLKEQEEDVVFLTDYEFSSSSAAACVLCGASINGRTAWQAERTGDNNPELNDIGSDIDRDPDVGGKLGIFDVTRDHDIFFFEMDGIVHAKGRIFPNRSFEVMAGSIGRSTMTQACHKSITEQHTLLITKGIAEVHDNQLVFRTHFVFNSPLDAACILSGMPVNGWKTWKNRKGETLGSLYGNSEETKNKTTAVKIPGDMYEPCNTCENAMAFLEALPKQQHKPKIHLTDAGYYLTEHCGRTCTKLTDIRRTFPKELLHSLIKDSETVKADREMLYTAAYWDLYLGNVLRKAIIAAMEEIGTPIHYGDLAIFIQKRNKNYHDILPHKVNYVLSHSPDIFQRIKPATYVRTSTIYKNSISGILTHEEKDNVELLRKNTQEQKQRSSMVIYLDGEQYIYDNAIQNDIDIQGKPVDFSDIIGQKNIIIDDDSNMYKIT